MWQYCRNAVLYGQFEMMAVHREGVVKGVTLS